MTAEYLRLLGNVCQFGTITQTKSAEGLALAKVKIDDRETDFFPVVSQSNSFKKHFIPIRVNEQVAVFCPFGEANIGFILRGIFNKSCKEPSSSNNDIEVIEYEDGTRFSYDTKAKKLTVNCVQDLEIIAKNLTIKADNTTFIGGGINHDGVDISKAHNHPQNSGNHFGGGANTSAPNGA